MPTVPLPQPFRLRRLLPLLLLWAAVYLASCFGPALLDDADSTHAEAAQAMLRTGDWVTLHVDGVRYLEKPPLPYWIAAASMRVFGENAFAVHLPLAITMLLLALAAQAWATEAFGERAGHYAGLMVLSSVGAFLFTRIFIPDALLSLLLLAALWALERLTRPAEAAFSRCWVVMLWLALAGAVLAKGLVALVFFLATAAGFLWLTGSLALWRRLRPFSGVVLFFAAAAPWHLLAGLRNTGGAGGHGFFWFYFINEHVLRFLGRRIPRDYNKLPAVAYWLLHLVWLFPWSALFPAAIVAGWKRHNGVWQRARGGEASAAERTVLLLGLFSALVLVFFSLSTNQEYYTFPVYAPVLMLTAAGLAAGPSRTRAWVVGLLALAAVCLIAATALGVGLWSARAVPAADDIGDLLAHRGVGQYTLSMSHFFDLTGPSFAALRLPAALAMVALAIGSLVALLLRRSTTAVVATLTATLGVFLVAAHLALVRFGPLLSSSAFADRIGRLEASGQVAQGSQVLIFGDQAFGSSIPFYLGRRVLLVDGRTTSMEFGSSFVDAPPIFLTHEQLLSGWGSGPRKLLFVPEEQRERVDALLGARAIPLMEQSRKLLVTDRPLDTPRANKDDGVNQP